MIDFYIVGQGFFLHFARDMSRELENCKSVYIPYCLRRRQRVA
jgi:hypothetical protein